jgi:hypothetical protein
MNNDERSIDDGDLPDDGPEESLDTDHFLNGYDGSSEEELEESETEARSGDEVAETPELAAEAATEPAAPPPVFNNFMDALYPKRAPAPRNARIIRRFDLEAAKYDPRPAPAPAPVLAPAPPAPAAPPVLDKKKEPLTREEARALRNRSLRAAAGLD